jgi:hypothetical protein
MRELVDTKAQLEAAESDYERMGFDAVERNAGRTVMKRGLRGTWLPHILYFFFAPVYGNLIYSAFRRYDRPERVVIRIRDFAERSADPAPEPEDGPTADDTDGDRDAES